MKDYADGKCNKVVIPISELTKARGAAFDLRSAWQFVFHHVERVGPRLHDLLG